jgi:NAD(P)H-dependent flavin oxidoreductase YrpB (nitropropane dioxygenase family)
MMSLWTPVCGLLGIDVPLVQAPVGSASGPGLAAAVAGAGGLGMLAQTWFDAGAAGERVRAARALTDRPVGVNLILDFPIQDRLEACLAERVPVVSTFWGDPASVHDQIHAAGALHLHTVASVRDARAAVDAGVDVLVAQGWEAGGHVQGTVATMALVPAVVDVAGDVPVVAAGGVADGRGLVAVLALGAQAVWLGTRFLTATEAGTHPSYRDAVIASSGQDAVHTSCFDGGWPGAPARALGNTTIRQWEAAGRPPAPDRPGEGQVVATDGSGRQYLRYDDMMPLPGMDGDLEAMARYAGQSAGLVHDVAPAAEIVTTVVDQARAVLAALPR